jgi:hypothetical protein
MGADRRLDAAGFVEDGHLLKTLFNDLAFFHLGIF